MLTEEDRQAMMTSTLTAWAITIAVIAVVFVIVKNCSVSVIY
jgi:hypothetical protein